MEWALLAIAGAAIVLGGASAALGWINYQRLGRLWATEQVRQKWAAAERALEEQRRAPEHKLSPPSRGMSGLWQGRCSCGWLSPGFENASDALDSMEAHKAGMPVRRAV